MSKQKTAKKRTMIPIFDKHHNLLKEIKEKTMIPQVHLVGMAIEDLEKKLVGDKNE